jgi:20S proteasome alpha/beta subunit
MDGMVLCTDSLETDGVTKRLVDKIWVYEVQDSGSMEWGIAIASAGEGDLADSFNDDLAEVLGNSDFDEVLLMSKLRAAIRQVRTTYQEAEFGFIAAVYGNPKLYSKMFRVLDRSSHFGPVKRYQAIGVGGGIANFLLSQLYTPSICVDEAARLGAFILHQVRGQTEGCDGPTSIVSFGGLGKPQQFRLWHQQEITAIEAEISRTKFREGLQKFWKEFNPSPPIPHIPLREGGAAHFRSTLKLDTIT